MSKPSLSDSSAGSAIAPPAGPASSDSSGLLGTRHISASEMRPLLRRLFAGDREASLLWQLREGLKDPLKESDNGRFKMNPFWLSLGILAFLALSCFLYFTFKRP